MSNILTQTNNNSNSNSNADNNGNLTNISIQNSTYNYYYNLSGIDIIYAFINSGRKAENTKISYKTNLINFYCDMFKVTPDNITRDMILKLEVKHAEEYERLLLDKINNEEIQPSTANTRLSDLKSFYKYLCTKYVSNELREQLIKFNPFEAIENFEEDDEKGSDPLTIDEINKMILSCDTVFKSRSERMKLMIELNCRTLIRREALCNLKLSDFRQVNENQYICEKKDKGQKKNNALIDKGLYDRLVVFYNNDMANRFKYSRGKYNEQYDTIFGITDNMYYKNIVKLADYIGIDKTDRKITPHSIKISMMKIGKDLGIPMSEIQIAARHSNPETTAYYVNKGNVAFGNSIGSKIFDSIVGNSQNITENDDNLIDMQTSLKNKYTVNTEKVDCIEDLANELNDAEVFNLIQRLQNKRKMNSVG